MNPALQSFLAGLAGLTVFACAALIVLRLPARMAPVTRLALLALAVHAGVCLAMFWLMPDATYWHGAALYWFGFNCYLYAFGAVYKSVSLRLLGNLAKAPGHALSLKTIVDTLVAPLFADRMALLVDTGLAHTANGATTPTPQGTKTAERIGTAQAIMGVGQSGLYGATPEQSAGNAPPSMLATLQGRMQRHGVLVLFAVALCLIGGIFVRGQELHMDTWMHPRFSNYAFPCAVSMLSHHGEPYVIYTEIPSLLTNDDLQAAAAMEIQRPDDTRLYVAEDKGIVDIVLLAFVLFGYSIEAIYYTTFLIFGATVLAYFLAYRHSAVRCLAPVIVLGATFAAMPSLLLSSESGSLTNPRVFEFLGLIPLLHVILAFTERGGITWSRALGLAVQVLVIVECIHTRCSASWMIPSAALCYVLILAAAYRGWLPNLSARQVLLNAWAALFLIAGLVGLKVYQATVYPAEYSTAMLQHRVVWHNVGIGLSLHPKLANQYRLHISDDLMTELVKRRIVERGDTERYEAIWGRPGEARYRRWPNAICQDFRLYEEECRDTVLEIARKHPRWILELFFYYKPKLAIRTLLWTANCYPRDEERLVLFGQQPCVPTSEEIAEGRLYIRHGDLALLSVGLALLCWCCRLSARSLFRLAGLMFVVLLGSAFPAFVSYPIIHVVGVSILCTTALALVLMTAALTAAGNMAAIRLARRRT
jgi:hypothetical protein